MLCPNTLPADDRDCQFLTCHTDLDNQRWPPSSNHKRFLNIQPVFFDGGRCLLGHLREIWGAGELKKEESGPGQPSTGDRDNPQRLLTIRDGGLIGTLNAIVTSTDLVSTLSFEVDGGTRTGLSSSLLVAQFSRIIPRVSRPLPSGSSRTRPVRAVHSADHRFVHFFFLHASTLNRNSSA